MPDTDVNDTAASKEEGSGELLKNLKSEMDRKLSNFQETLKSTTDALTAKLNEITVPKAPAHSAPSKSFRDKFYEDEDAAVNELKTEIRSEVMGTLEEREKHTNAINRLYGEYPELADSDADLTKEAVKIFKTLSKAEQANPNAYRVAVLEAATELGVQPLKKRKKESSEDFTGGGGNGGGKRNNVGTDTLEFARLMGLDTEDPKVVERLKNHTKRSFNHYS